MTRTEHLLTILAEECCEVAHRATKALRFGLDEVQPGQDQGNASRVMGEYADLLAVVEMLCDEGSLPRIMDLRSAIDAKKAKVEKFYRYSIECGLAEEPPCR